MPTISHLVKKIIQSRPLLQEALSYNIINYANLADYLKVQIKAEMGEDVKDAAIVMALRRVADKMQKKEKIDLPFKFNTEIIMKTGLADITLVKSPLLLQKLKQVYALVDHNKGETSNIIIGNYEITVVISEKYLEKVLAICTDETLLNKELGLVSIAMSFSKEFFYTPGIIAKVSRKLHWENINVYENISTMTELIFVVHKKDATRAYQALQKLIEEQER